MTEFERPEEKPVRHPREAGEAVPEVLAQDAAPDTEESYPFPEELAAERKADGGGPYDRPAGGRSDETTYPPPLDATPSVSPPAAPAPDRAEPAATEPAVASESAPPVTKPAPSPSSAPASIQRIRSKTRETPAYIPVGRGAEPMLQVQSLTKRFGDIAALDGAEFSIGEGEVVGLLGENGAGKTTTLKLLSGALFPTSGKVIIGGRDMGRDFLGARRMVGYLPEKLPLDKRMRVRRYLDYVASLRGIPGKQRADAVDRVLTLCTLEGVAKRNIGVLSRGLKMRVGLAQALVHNPELVLLDEPTAGLDPQQVLNMRELIFSLAGNHTILFSSHNLTEVSECCSRVVLLRAGKVVAEDALASLAGKREGKETVFMRFVRPPDNLLSQLAEIPNVTHVEAAGGGAPGTVLVQVQSAEGVRERLIENVVYRSWGLCEFREVTNNLAELFQRRPEEN